MSLTTVPPEAPAHPIRPMRAVRAFLRNQIDFITSTATTGPVAKVTLGPPLMRRDLFLLHTVEGARTLLSAKTWHNFRKDPVFYQEIRLGLGDGILTAQDDDWLRQKRFVQPVFTRARVDGYLAFMLAEIADVAASWHAADGPVDLGATMQHLTLRIVGDALFGDGLDDVESDVAIEFPRLQQAMLSRVPMGGKVPTSWPLPVNRRFRSSQSALHGAVDRLISQRQAAGTAGEDLISLLLAARDREDRLSPDEVRDQVLIFLLAGHETTSSTLTFALHLLGRHPEIQQAVRDEVAAVLGSSDPTAAQVHGQLPYTTAVLKETMRLYPSAPFVGRTSVEAYDVDGCAVPAGSDSVLSIWSIHHDPSLWPDPERFDPTRFLGEPAHDRYAWMPFGAGPRACIGQHFSMLEAVAALALLVRDFDLESEHPSDQVPVNSAVTIYPEVAVRARVTPLA